MFVTDVGVQQEESHERTLHGRRCTGRALMTPRAKVPRPKSSAIRDFVDAVHALSDEPSPANVVRYLAASRALEVPQPTRRTRAQARGLR
jgi:hypothetical protein